MNSLITLIPIAAIVTVAFQGYRLTWERRRDRADRIEGHVLAMLRVLQQLSRLERQAVYARHPGSSSEIRSPEALRGFDNCFEEELLPLWRESKVLLTDTHELGAIETGISALQNIRNELLELELDAAPDGIPYVNAKALTESRKRLEVALDDLAAQTGSRVAAAGRIVPRLRRA
jgi:hypothetical protein